MSSLSSNISLGSETKCGVNLTLDKKQYESFTSICEVLGLTPVECLKICIAKTVTEQRIPYVVSHIPDPYLEDTLLEDIEERLKVY